MGQVKSRQDSVAPRTILNWIAIAALLVIFFAWQAAHLGGFERDYDEGAHFMQAQLVHASHSLYSEVFSASPPLFILSIVGAFKLFGASVVAGRAIIVAYATVGLWGVALAAQELKGKGAGLAAIALLAIAPNFFHWSRGALGDLPSSSLATLSVAFALRYWRARGKHWLVLAGLALGTSSMVKLIPAATLVPVVLLVLLAQNTHLPS